MKSSRATIQFVFVTVLLEWIGVGIVIPVLPEAIRRFGNSEDFVTRYFGYFVAVYALMQFLASPVLGAISDRFGRRPVLLVSLLGASLDYLFMGFAPSLPLLFFGRVLSGLTGAGMTVASSYIADISDDKNRTKNFGFIGVGFGLGFIIGPSIGGALGSYGYTYPFIAAALMNFLNFVWGFFVLPESLPMEKRNSLAFKKVNPFSALKSIFVMQNISGLLLIYFLMFLAGQVHPSNWTLYTQSKFGWGAREVGFSLAYVGLVMSISQGILTGLLVPKIGEVRALKISILINCLGFLGFALATKGWMMYAIVTATCVSGLAGPSIQSLIARKVQTKQQGKLQGTLNSIASLTAIIAPLLYSNLFAHFAGSRSVMFFPGAAYTMAAIVSAGALVVFRLIEKVDGIEGRRACCDEK